MNWKIKLVLLFSRLRGPIKSGADGQIKQLRAKSDQAAAMGTFLFDKILPVRSVIKTSADTIPLTIYKSSEASKQRVIVFYHGGGFVLYGTYSHDAVCRRLSVMNNCIVVSVDYRLAPEHVFPAAHEDAYTALQWVVQNISGYGGNPSDIVLMGDSAGGNLAACLAHRCKMEDINLRAQVLIYPWIDGRLSNESIKRNGKGYLLEEESMIWFREQYLPNPEDRCRPEVSPCFENDFSDLAPAMIVTAELDPLLDDGFYYAEQLKQAGNVLLYKEYPGLFHGFINIPKVHKSAMQVFHDIQNFLLKL
jgi:acetyl esterase